MSILNNIPRVLIVDKSETWQKVFRTAFEGARIETVFCTSGSEALKILENLPCNIVIGSMILDDMDGIELCLRMRRLKDHTFTPFILATSADSTQAGKTALPAGVTEIFNKADIQELIAFVSRFLRSQTDPIRGQVLLIEDNRSQRLMMCEIFKRWGLTVDAFGTAEEAWPPFLEKNYDLVVTDIVLAGVMNGLDFISNIRRHAGANKDVPILAITGFDDVSRRIELFNLGVSDYVIKPIISEELIARVRNLISHQHQSRIGS